MAQGILVEVFIFRMPPASAPVDVMLIIIAVVSCAAILEAAGGLKYMLQIAEKIQKIFDMTPYGIIKRFNLKKPIYQPTATYGHFGRELPDAKVEGIKVSFFPWEKLDYVEKIKKAFNL